MSTPAIPTEQNAVVYDQYGESSVLHVKRVPVVQPGEGEVLVQINAAGVNPADFKIRAGYWKAYPTEFPAVPGWDLSGVVVANGHAARRFQPGDEVFAYARRPKVALNHGTYAQYITLPEAYLTAKPKSVSHEVAGGVPLTALTAYQGLKQHGALKPGQSVLVIGASGGVGLFAVQLAKHVFGAKNVIGVASAKNAEFVKKHGATGFIDYKADIKAELHKLLPEGVDLVYDCFGGDGLKVADQYVRAEGGHVVSIAGAASSTNPKVIAKGYLVEPHVIQLAHIAQLIDEGTLKVHVDKTYKLEEVAKAHDDIASFHTTGKIVLTISH